MILRTLALSAVAAQASAGLLYGLTFGQGGVEVGTLNLPNASLHVIATSNASLLVPSQLITLGEGRTAYTLAQNVTTAWMDLVGFDLLTATVQSSVRTNLPGEMLVGNGQEMAFIPSTGEVALWGIQTPDNFTTPWILQAVNPLSGLSRVIASFPPLSLAGFLGNGYAGFDPVSNRFFTMMRNTSNSNALTALFIDVTTGDVRTQLACPFSTVELDPTTGQYVGFSTFRNGTTLKDVYKTIGTIAANGTGVCTPAKFIIFDEATALPYVLAEGISAFDNESRRTFGYVLSGTDPDSPGKLIAVNVDTGAVEYFPGITESNVVETLLVSGMCADSSGC